jgi:AcrR family transcriptional regulator
VSKGEATRQTILDRASALASKLGLEGLTIGTLATDLGLSKSGLFAHFRSKEALQVQVLEHIAGHFVELVVKPALKAPRGEPRLRALFENLFEWPKRYELPGGCPLISAVSELDDRPGPARELLVRQQRDWLDVIATIVRTALAEKHFRADVDPEQFAFEFHGIQFAYHTSHRLLADPSAERRARAAFEALVERARRS